MVGEFHAHVMLGILATAEQVAAPRTGALVCESRGRRRGTVLLEEGRICWAVAEGMRKRLTDLLLEQGEGAFDRRLLEETFVHCKVRRVPIGEELVRRSLVDADGLRAALARHTAEALVAVGGDPASTCTWVPHQRRSYDARFTFSTVEVATRVAGQVYPNEVTKARDGLAKADGPAASFLELRGSCEVFPLALTKADELVEHVDVWKLGHHALQAVQGLERNVGRKRLVVWRGTDGAAMSAWRDGGLVFAQVHDGAGSLARTLGGRIDPS